MALPLSDDEKQKLKKVIDEGVQTQAEINDLKEGLKETVDAVAKELDVKKSHINKAIKARAENNLEEKKDEMNQVEEILEATK